MQVGPLMHDLVGAVIGWLGPRSEGAADRMRRADPDSAASDDRVVGSRASGYHGEGAHFYTWQRTRSEVDAWVSELAPCDHQGSERRR